MQYGKQSNKRRSSTAYLMSFTAHLCMQKEPIGRSQKFCTLIESYKSAVGQTGFVVWLSTAGSTGGSFLLAASISSG